MEVTEAGEAAEAENFPKNKYGSKCLQLPNSARNAKKNFCTRAAREYCQVPARAARKSYFWTIFYQMANPEFSHFLPKKFLFTKSVIFG